MTDKSAHEQDIGLRPAGAQDADFLLRIRNHPSTRAASFNQDVVALEGHLEWLGARLARPAPHLYVVTGRQGEDAGVARLDLAGAGDATVNITIAPEQRGGGIGAAALAALAAEAGRAAGIQRLIAYVLPGNEASQALFDRAGYGKVGRVEADPAGNGPPEAAWRYELLL